MLIQTVEFQKRESNGYIEILTDDGWIQEHRYVVEQFIGRKLTKDEKVHHDNFFKKDNRIENLTLFPNQKAHSHLHRQIRQFGITQPRITELKKLKELMLIERRKNRI